MPIIRFVVPCILLVRLAAPALAQGSRIQAEVHGLVLVNGFVNGDAVNNSDVPQFVLLPPAPGGPPASAAGATIRQSRVTVRAGVPEFAGGHMAAELDVDFFGGQQPSNGGRTFPLLRIRRAFAELTRGRLNLFVGQESPLIVELNPSSIASIGVPEFAAAGNLWLWLPQIRLGIDLVQTGAARVGLEAAALAPTSGDAQTAFFTQPDIAERSSRPFVEGRARVRWGEGDERGEVSVGGHYGWLAVGPERRVHSKAVTVSLWTPLARGLELRGEAFTGQALAGLGGGGIGQNFGRDSAAVGTSGGWVQLNVLPTPAWEIGGGGGMDDPDDQDLDPATQRLRNLTLEGHLTWRRAPAVVGVALRRLSTRYGAGRSDVTTTQVNLGLGFEF
jgi:hypothetical protein